MSTPTATRKTQDDTRLNVNPNATEAAARALHETVDRFASKAAAAEVDLRKAAAASGDKLVDSQQRAKEKLDETLTRTNETLRGHPLASVGIAFAAGALVTSLLRR